MIIKSIEKEKAISLRREGKTYSEIMKVVPVAKSTISLWLREVGLSKKQKQNITAKRIAGQRKGADARRSNRIKIQSEIISKAKSEIGNLSKKDLFLIGVVLYWAEGSKEKEWNPGQKLAFSNMDSRIIQLFLRWLVEIAKVPKDMIGFEISIHETHKSRVPEVIDYWAKITRFQRSCFNKVYFKTAKIKKTNRHNIGDTYFGLLRVTVKNSSTLVRKIAGWSDGVACAK